jgi:hypothetical protein
MKLITIYLTVLSTFSLCNLSCTHSMQKMANEKTELFSKYIAKHRLSNCAAWGTIRGTVEDIHNSTRLPYVKVIIAGPEDDTIFSNSLGFFEKSDLSPGAYTVEARMFGYKDIRTDSFEIRSGDIFVINFELALNDRVKYKGIRY